MQSRKVLYLNLVTFIFVGFFFLLVNYAAAQINASNGNTGSVTASDSGNVNAGSPGNVQAGNATSKPISVQLQNPFAFKTINDFIDKLLNIIIKIGEILAVFFIIWAGFKLVTAGGNIKAIEDAKSMLLWTVIGVTIVLGAKAIQILVSGTVDNIIK